MYGRATRIEILLSESGRSAEGLDRVLTLPWSRPSSCRRREIDPAPGRSAATPTSSANESARRFIKALRDAHDWLDELLVDPTQTIESLAVREGQKRALDPNDAVLPSMSPALAEAAMEGRLPRSVLRQAPDRPADAVVEAMARAWDCSANQLQAESPS